MSGFGGAFAAAMVGVVFVVAMSSMASMTVSYMGLYQKLEAPTPDRVSISIDGGRIASGGTELLVNMTLLAGSDPMSLRDLARSDAFIVYSSGGDRVFERVGYGEGWRILAVTVGGQPELVSPIRGSSGMWDPGETIEMSVSPSMPVDAGSPWLFKFATAGGGVFSMTFGG
ncbi:MAG: hypothetical protein NQU41_01050 [Candidatus Methanosuratincola sp.]|uniref:Uncharacterized protein n=2 Tax=Candidatus Methanosuratincola (ex Vanwonterghem et al. 2016) TaxID=1915412 RepID=A0A7J3V0L1_9CREN|nr:hypothetical protein [Candidatus Methanosuratincola sp.]RWX73315.1 MAG: hypothetical protein Metus_1289 [Candidatus Methanosuratincola subterraneus]